MRSPGCSVSSIDPDGTQKGLATKLRMRPVTTKAAISENQTLPVTLRHSGFGLFSSTPPRYPANGRWMPVPECDRSLAVELQSVLSNAVFSRLKSSTRGAFNHRSGVGVELPATCAPSCRSRGINDRARPRHRSSSQQERLPPRPDQGRRLVSACDRRGCRCAGGDREWARGDRPGSDHGFVHFNSRGSSMASRSQTRRRRAATVLVSFTASAEPAGELTVELIPDARQPTTIVADCYGQVVDAGAAVAAPTPRLTGLLWTTIRASTYSACHSHSAR